MNQQTPSLIGLAFINLKDMINNNSNHSKYHHIASPWQPLINHYFLVIFSYIV